MLIYLAGIDYFGEYFTTLSGQRASPSHEICTGGRAATYRSMRGRPKGAKKQEVTEPVSGATFARQRSALSASR